ncbi:ATP-binding cassette domain-containing protein [Paenibacillus xylanivorans]|uniref:ATP-binding cassette domain-containing protein n=1 Tax=Paenibacillus xylanivorans TaxID=1705561 RepID=UPI0009E8D655
MDLNGVTFQLQEGERAGLIERNGSGKSKLLRLIAGCDHVDEGVLTRRKDSQTGWSSKCQVLKQRSIRE